MGCDGGTIPRRDEMVKLKKKAEKADRDVELAAKWRHCALSAEPLRQPIVACELGRLYNKETVLMALLDKSSMPEVGRHIRSLKDVVELKLSPNPSYKPSEKADEYNDTQAAEYVCPVSALEMSGRYRFCFLRVCGCVLSEKALKEVPSENCHKCGRPFTDKEVVVINGSEEDEKRQREAMIERRRQARLSKRKRKADSSPGESSASSSGSDKDSSERESPPLEKKQKPLAEAAASAPVAAANERHVSKVPPTTGACGKGPASGGSKLGSKLVAGKHPTASGTSSKLNSSSSVSLVTKKATEAVGSSFKTVAEDPGAREAYKSLFNSGAKERGRDQTSHWVTFFPYH